jgi:hypothetical protein
MNANNGNLQNSNLSFIGSGVMGEAMIKAVLKQNLMPCEQIVARPLADRLRELSPPRRRRRPTMRRQPGRPLILAEAAGAAQVLDGLRVRTPRPGVEHRRKAEGACPWLPDTRPPGCHSHTLANRPRHDGSTARLPKPGAGASAQVSWAMGDTVGGGRGLPDMATAPALARPTPSS